MFKCDFGNMKTCCVKQRSKIARKVKCLRTTIILFSNSSNIFTAAIFVTGEIGKKTNDFGDFK